MSFMFVISVDEFLSVRLNPRDCCSARLQHAAQLFDAVCSEANDAPIRNVELTHRSAIDETDLLVLIVDRPLRWHAHIVRAATVKLHRVCVLRECEVCELM